MFQTAVIASKGLDYTGTLIAMLSGMDCWL